MKQFIDIQPGEKKNVKPLESPSMYNTTFQNDSYETIVYRFDEELLSKLELFSEEKGSTLFTTMLTAFHVLLNRHNNEENIGLWNITDEHSVPEILVLPAMSNGEITFTFLLHEIEKAILAVERKKYPHEGNKGMLCKTLFVMQQTSEPIAEEYVSGTEKDLVFIISDSWKPEVIVKFCADVYRADVIKQMITHFKLLLYAILNQPDQKTGALPMQTEAEMHELLKVFNDTTRPYPAEKTIVDLFEQQALKTPANIALYMDDCSMSYDELNKRSNQLAGHLIAMGVKKEDNVGLVVKRSFDMVIGLLAILKSGAAYVPAEPDYPLERQNYMLTQSSVRLIVSDIDNPLGDLGAAFTFINMHTVAYDKYSSDNPHIDINSRQLAYTIYTSGSTGVPKGVMIEHHSAVNLINWVNKEFNVGTDDRLLFITSMCFDLSVYDIFGMLAAGGSIVIATKDDVLNIRKLAILLKSYRITFWDSVPSTLDYLVNRLASENPDYRQDSLRLVFMSGDWIPVCLAEKTKNYFENARVISLGGATECTVWSNFFPILKVNSAWRSIPYGKPIDNNTFYILNEQLQPVPHGVAGELFIGGVGVARGYANDPEKTRKSFLPDPFTGKPGDKMYRTGDLGRMLPDLTMEFIGRKDDQVKIRGHRVEIGEIEAVIRQCDSVKSCVVLYCPHKSQLIGYVVPDQYYDRDMIISSLKKKLPDYMIPVKWVELNSIPLTGNGKTDKKALLEMDARELLKNECVAPRNELERTLIAIWQQVLDTNEIGVQDNFFELGGQSLLAVELITKMEEKTGKKLPLNSLYKYPTIARISLFLQEECEENKWKYLVAIKPTGNKIPLYLVHGDGLSLSNFQNLGKCIDNDQPIFSLQPIGLNGAEEPPENIADIAKCYVNEILEHNPTGPYALAGYSFGGYVSVEMKKQLELMGKKVKMVAIFDTDAENISYKKDWVSTLPKRIKRQIPKFLFIARSMFKRPTSTIMYQYSLFSKKINNLCYTLGLKQKPELKGINLNLDKISETHLKAFKNYQLTSFNDKIYLFKAKHRMYFVDDFEYLGWKNYALKGVSAYEVPGDHKTMFQPPNVSELARLLQHALDNC